MPSFTVGIDIGSKGAVAAFNGRRFYVRRWTNCDKYLQARNVEEFLHFIHNVDGTQFILPDVVICKGFGERINIVVPQANCAGYIEAEIKHKCASFSWEPDSSLRKDAGINDWLKKNGRPTAHKKAEFQDAFREMTNMLAFYTNKDLQTFELSPDEWDACIGAYGLWRNLHVCDQAGE